MGILRNKNKSEPVTVAQELPTMSDQLTAALQNGAHVCVNILAQGRYVALSVFSRAWRAWHGQVFLMVSFYLPGEEVLPSPRRKVFNNPEEFEDWCLSDEADEAEGQNFFLHT